MDALIGTALMLLVFVGITAVFQLSIDVITNNRARAGALALANERMEYLRSLSYDGIGVIGGIPAGIVPQEEDVESSDITYTRRTMVFYTDDPGDGEGAADTNDIIADYKTIRVEVSWQSRQGERSITLLGRVSPQGVEDAVPGGILTVNVVDESGDPVADAEVEIYNTGTSPAISIRTYTNIEGSITFIGAPAASDYQIVVSKPGYSRAETYDVTAENPNPDPRHLTVVDNQTTSIDLTIDLVSEKSIETFMQIREGTWTDTFADGTKVDEMASTTVSGSLAHLQGASGSYEAEGEMQSITVAPALLYEWKEFVATTLVPGGTELVFRFYDASGTALVPEGQLPGNAAGFSATSVDLTGISTTTYPSLRVTSTFTSADPSETPVIDEYSLIYDWGPEPLPNLPFTLRGAKAIGNNPTVYKYDEEHESDADASITISNLEADTYTIAVAPSGGYTLAESCAPQPEALPPASEQSTRIYVLPASAHSLLIDARSNAGALLQDASINLTAAGYDETLLTSGCGQSFFDDIASGDYTASVTLSGYQPYTTSVTVSGATALSVVLTPQ